MQPPTQPNASGRMYAVEAAQPFGDGRLRRWISGFFQREADAQAYLRSVPEPARALQRIVEVPQPGYPVFVIEDQGFAYGGLDVVRQALGAASPRGDEDHVHLNIYLLRGDFAPSRPGQDAMGALQHWHITDDTLAPPRAAEFDADLQAIADPRRTGAPPA